MADSVQRDILHKVNLIHELDTNIYSSLGSGFSLSAMLQQQTTDAIGSGCSYLGDALVAAIGSGCSYLGDALVDRFPSSYALGPLDNGVYNVTLPAAGNYFLSEFITVDRYKEHMLSLFFTGGATAPTAGKLSVCARLYNSADGYVGSVTLCSTDRLHYNGAIFTFGWRGGCGAGAGDGFTSVDAIALVAIPKMKLEFFIDTTYDNGPWQASLWYHGAS